MESAEEAAAFLVSLGYTYREIMDYEHGMDFETLALHMEYAQKNEMQRSKMRVQELMVALGSLFDAKVSRTFFDALNTSIKKINDPDAQFKRDVTELGKLRSILSAGG